MTNAELNELYFKVGDQKKNYTDAKKEYCDNKNKISELNSKFNNLLNNEKENVSCKIKLEF